MFSCAIVVVVPSGVYSDCEQMVQGALRSRRLQQYLALKEYLLNKELRENAAKEASAEKKDKQPDPTLQSIMKESPSAGPGPGKTRRASFNAPPKTLPLQRRRHSLGHECGTFVHFSRQLQQWDAIRRTTVSQPVGSPVVKVAEPFRLCVIAPLNCARLFIEIAFWWFGALRLKKLRVSR